MGVIVKEKVEGSGVYWVFINHNGRRASKCVGSEKAAQKVKEIIEARIKLGQTFLPEERKSVPTMEEYYRQFEKTYLNTAVRQSTRESYEGNFRIHILPELGKLRLDAITRERIKGFVAELVEKPVLRPKRIKIEGREERGEVGRPLSRPSIRIITAELCALLNHAREDGYIVENPADRLGKLYKSAKVVHEEIEPLTAEEVPVFLDAVMSRSSEHYPLFLCAIHTGLRSGELAGLQWGDIDFKGRFLVVRRTLVSGRIHPPKTGKTRRVDLSDDLLSTLEALRRTRQEKGLAKGQNEISDWVFCNGEGNPCDMHNVKNRHFYGCLKLAGIRRIRFHDLRHTFASLLIQNGEPLAYIKEQLGHSSIKMTVDVYGHLVPGANRQAVNRLPSLKDRKSQNVSSAQIGQKKFVERRTPDAPERHSKI